MPSTSTSWRRRAHPRSCAEPCEHDHACRPLSVSDGLVGVRPRCAVIGSAGRMPRSGLSPQPLKSARMRRSRERQRPLSSTQARPRPTCGSLPELRNTSVVADARRHGRTGSRRARGAERHGLLHHARRPETAVRDCGGGQGSAPVDGRPCSDGSARRGARARTRSAARASTEGRGWNVTSEPRSVSDSARRVNPMLHRGRRAARVGPTHRRAGRFSERVAASWCEATPATTRSPSGRRSPAPPRRRAAVLA